MRRIHRKRRKNQRKILMIFGVCFLFIMTAGYAAFSTSINITAKGNILTKQITINDLKKQLTNTGDGLYVDTVNSNIHENEERYIYRGDNPNNYIWFNNEMWRIVAIESDNKVKIVKDIPEDNQAFDKGNNNDYSTSSLKDYLNNEYYNSLKEEDKKWIANDSTFYIGSIENSRTDRSKEETQISEESKIWTGDIALLNFSDYLKASTNSGCLTFLSARSVYQLDAPCSYNNYLQNRTLKIGVLLLNGHSSLAVYIMWYTPDYNSYIISYISANTYKHSNGQLIYTKPVLFLKADITLSGEGTKGNPYKILN